MGTDLNIQNFDPDQPAAIIRQTPGRGQRVPTNQPALVVVQDAESGSDGVALEVSSNNSDAPALDVIGDARFSGNIEGLSIQDRMQYAGFLLPNSAPTLRRVPSRVATTSYLMQTGHGWTSGGGGTASSNLNDTSVYIKGTQSIRVTTAANGTQSQIRKTGLSSMDLTGKAMRLTFRVEDNTYVDRINFYVASSSFANYFQWTFYTKPSSMSSARYIQNGEWVTVVLQWADVSNSGGTYSITNGLPSTKTGFTELQFAVYDDAGGAVTYYLQSVEVVTDSTDKFPDGVVSVTFDDSWKTQYTLARPKMDNLGYRGTLYTISEYINSVGTRMTTSDLRSLQNNSGWEVSGHSYSTSAHGQTNGFSDLTSTQVDEEFVKLKLWLAENGFTGQNFAYPKGHFEVTTDGVPVSQLAEKYWRTSRTIISDIKAAWPPPMPQRVHALTGVSDASGAFWTPTKVAESGGVLDRCKGSGDWLILCFHEITTGTPADTTVITQTGFNSIMDAIASRSIPVHTIEEVVSYYT